MAEGLIKFLTDPDDPLAEVNYKNIKNNEN